MSALDQEMAWRLSWCQAIYWANDDFDLKVKCLNEVFLTSLIDCNMNVG